MINKKHLVGTVAAVAIASTVQAKPCQASTPCLEPEVVSTVWVEDGKEKAAVSINGKELVTYTGSESATAEQRAQHLAERVESVLELDKEVVGQILPWKEGETPAIKSQGKTIAKLDLPVLAQEEDNDEQVFQASLKIVNAIRLSVGGSPIPKSYLDYADAIANGGTLPPDADADSFSGKASWYGRKFHGRRTSNGETFDMEALTAAHRTLPFGTQLLVTNRKTGKSCVVKVNDRGPYHGNRVIDLSMAAARKLNMISSGVGVVDCFVLGVK